MSCVAAVHSTSSMGRGQDTATHACGSLRILSGLATYQCVVVSSIEFSSNHCLYLGQHSHTGRRDSVSRSRSCSRRVWQLVCHTLWMGYVVLYASLSVFSLSLSLSVSLRTEGISSTHYRPCRPRRSVSGATQVAGWSRQ